MRRANSTVSSAKTAAAMVVWFVLMTPRGEAQVASATATDFAGRIQPIFQKSCVGCHGARGAQAGLRLDGADAVMQGGISGKVIVPGRHEASLLYQRINAGDPKVRMPPAGAALTAGECALIAAWIDSLAESPSSAAAHVDYAKEVEPILRESCYGCHSGTRPKAQLRLDVKSAALKGGMSGPVIVPGSSEKSRIIHRVEGRGGEPRMPLQGEALKPRQVATLARWIDQGATWPDGVESREAQAVRHWAYVKPVKPAPPAVKNAAAVRNPIDTFILARLEQEGLTYSPEASKEKLARRVYLDLTGLPPSPAELDAFLNDSRPDAYESLVDRLLASPHFGERWARPWLDLARYGDSNGYEADHRRTIWMYRDWVIQALNRDLPFDQFTIEQIAGDMLPDATQEQRIATGFHRNTQFNEEGGVDKDESYFEVQVDRVATTGTVWLGSTLGCAQCHNHKFDPFTQKDFYSMMAFFNNVEKRVVPGGDTSTYYHEAVLESPTAEQKAKREALDKRIEELEQRTSTMTPDLKAEQSQWERSILEAEGAWHVLKPAKLTAAAGTTLTADGEGRILAGGAEPRDEAYVIECDLSGTGATGIRLEALPQASLHRGGPGRDPYGNFIISDLRLEVPDGAGWKQVAIGKVWADTSTRPLKRKDDELWGVDATRDDTRLERQLVMIPGEPVHAARVRVTIVQESELDCQSLGYFRLSATDRNAPETIVRVSYSLRDLLGKEGRSEKLEKQLAGYFLSVAPSLQKARDELKRLNDERDKLDIASTLVMQEKPAFTRPYDFIRARGGFSSKGEQVYANVPAFLPPLPESEMPNRLGLARWLASRENPLTARVAMNRIWEQYFGRGIVETSEDFGSQGQKPSHPELLDWLATEFMDRGWSMKAMHRLIVTSGAYRQSSGVTPELLAKDPYNRLLARGPRFRMEAEMVRDATLAESGLLSRKIGGPSVFPSQPPGIWDMPYNDDKYIESKGEDRYRRGLYTFIRRSAPYPALMNFDATSREICTVRRTRTNTPLQALTLLNDKAFFEAAQALARRLIKEGGAETPSRIDYGFRLCTGRHATPDEVEYLTRWQAGQRVKFEQKTDSAKSVAGDADLATWTMVANVLLNLDEAITKE